MTQGSNGKPLEGKVAMVTGAAGAIGYGICQVLAENGCRVAVSDLPGEKLDEFSSTLDQEFAGQTAAVAMDVTDPEAVKAAFADTLSKFGRLDIVVHAAGIPLVARLMDIELEDFQRLERVNIEGTFLVITEAGRVLSKQDEGGDIVIISTKNVPSPSAGFGAYSATKAACHQLGRLASLEFAEYGIRVNMVAPDGVFQEGKYKSGLWELVGADRMKDRGLDEQGLREYYQNRNLLKTAVTGRHVANAVLFFVTGQTPTTGATIPVDGGLPDAVPR